MSQPKQIALPTGLPVGPVNVYLFTEPEPVLVDTGIKSEESLKALKSALADHALTIADLTTVIISHPHIDHCGLAGIISARSQADIRIFEPAKPWLMDYPRQWRKRTEYYRHQLFVYWDLPEEISQPILNYYRRIEHAFDDIPAERVNTFQAGDHLMMGGLPWRVLHTPGHADTLTCFYQAETRQLLSTDMLLPVTPTPIPETPPEGQEERTPSLPQFLESLKMVETLDCDIVYPGHGDPFTNHRQLIQRQRDRIAARKAQCLSLIERGHTKLAELVLKMYAHYPPEFRFAGLWMAIGYIDLLTAEGKVELVETEQNRGKVEIKALS